MTPCSAVTNAAASATPVGTTIRAVPGATVAVMPLALAMRHAATRDSNTTDLSRLVTCCARSLSRTPRQSTTVVSTTATADTRIARAATTGTITPTASPTTIAIAATQPHVDIHSVH